MNKRYQIGIIGYGDFTKVLIELLAPYADIYVSSRSAWPAIDGAEFVPLEEVLQKEIIIPSIPAQFYDSVLSGQNDNINPDSLWIDVASVKVKPLRALERLLPTSCQIIGTHPMFGPASIAKNGGIEGLRCAFMPVRASQALVDRSKDFLGRCLGLRIIETTPEQHDHDMAYVQGLSHYIGRVMDIMEIPETPLATMAYEDLLDMRRIQGGDSWDLFMSIVHENPYVPEVQASFRQACRQLDDNLDIKNLK